MNLVHMRSLLAARGFVEQANPKLDPKLPARTTASRLCCKGTLPAVSPRPGTRALQLSCLRTPKRSPSAALPDNPFRTPSTPRSLHSTSITDTAYDRTRALLTAERARERTATASWGRKQYGRGRYHRRTQHAL